MTASAPATSPFPLGGIGAGGFSISGSGRLIDWSIRNRPALQGFNGYSHFAIKAEQGGELLDARVLNGPYEGSTHPAHPDRARCFDGFGCGANRQTTGGRAAFRGGRRSTGASRWPSLRLPRRALPGRACA